MTIAIRKTPRTPEQRLAQKIRARTNDTRDILDLLHEIAQGEHDATEHDRLTATGILFDRGYGKTPKRAPTVADPAPETGNNDVGALREAPPAKSPRLVTQLDDSLHEAIGPAPTTHSPQSTTHYPPETKDSPQETIQSIIQDHVIDITNDGDTLIDVLMDIAWPKDTPETNREVKPYHRNRAGKMLLERAAGTDSTPDLSQIVSKVPGYPLGYVFDPTKNCIYCSRSLNMPEGHEGEHRHDYEGLAKAHAEVQRMLDEQGIEPDPDAPKLSIEDLPKIPPGWIENNIDLVRQENAKFDEELKLRIERQKAWPAVEERRRKKLARMYPSHSEDQPAEADSNPPDP